jgi:hypothetical protein
MGQCYENDNVFPIISRVINQICQEKRAGKFRSYSAGQVPGSLLNFPAFGDDYDPEYALHHEIVDRLMADPGGRRELAAARRRCPQRSEEWLAGNMVAFWSQTITQGNSFYGRRFDRVQRKQKWAYKPKASS